MRHDTLDPFAPEPNQQGSSIQQQPYGEDASYDIDPTGSLSEEPKGGMQAFTDKAKSYFESAQRELAPKMKQLRPELENARNVITREATAHPLRTAGIALGIGWILGKGLPKVLAVAGIYGLTRLAK